MRRLGRFLGFIVFVGIGLRFPAGAAQPISISSDITLSQITVQTLLEHATSRGYVPVQVEIRNRMNRAGSWTLNFSTSQDELSVMDTRYVVEVDPSSSKRVELMVPMAPATNSRYSRGYGGSMEVRVTGPGARGRTHSILSHNWSSRGSDAIHVGLSQSVALQMREPLKQLSDNQRSDLSIHSLDLSLFPRDDRGLSGLDVLVLSREEWKSATLPAKTVERWVALGGHLFILNAQPTDKLPRDLGMGRIHTLRAQPMPSQVNELYAILAGIGTIRARLQLDSGYLPTRWDFSDRVKPIIPSFGLFMMVVVVIAALLGPLNLWWGFRKKNIMRVLWTTPALSLGLSLLVGIGIIVSDGFGGTGLRSLWIMILPDEQLEVKLQEQVSRTGVLLGNSFTLPQGVRMHPVRVQKRSDNSLQMLSEASDGTRSGGWFANRRIQGQVLEQVRTSRARVEITNRSGGAPEVISTIGVPFTLLLVRDNRGNIWKAENTQPGKPILLGKGNNRDVRNLYKTSFKRQEHPGKGKGLQVGWFVALTDPSFGEWVDSLGSIRWEDQPVVYTGPMVQKGGQP